MSKSDENWVSVQTLGDEWNDLKKVDNGLSQEERKRYANLKVWVNTQTYEVIGLHGQVDPSTLDASSADLVQLDDSGRIIVLSITLRIFRETNK